MINEADIARATAARLAPLEQPGLAEVVELNCLGAV